MKQPIYLDNNSTTQVDPLVLEAMLPVLKEHFGNPASQTHSYGWYAQELVQIAREHVANLLGGTSEEIVFTSSATEANNLAIIGLATAEAKRRGTKDLQIISCRTEHKSVLNCLEALREHGFQIKLLDVNKNGVLSPETFEAALTKNSTENTILASFMFGNNEMGALHDLKTLGEICQKRGVLFHCDATQAAGKLPVDVKTIQADLLSLSAHKLYGPKGIGALYIRKRSPRISLKPIICGSGQEDGLRSGTLNTSGIVGFGKACEIAKTELTEEKEKLMKLSSNLLEGLQAKLDGVTLNGPPIEERLPGNLNLSFAEVSNAALIGEISSKVAISTGSACTSADQTPSHVLSALGIPPEVEVTCVRVGIGRFNTEEEINQTVEAFTLAINKLR